MISRGTAPGRNYDSGIGTDRQEAYKHSAPEFDDPRDHLFRGFLYEYFFSADQRDHRVRIAFHKLDQIGVHDHLLVVQTIQSNHEIPLRSLRTVADNSCPATNRHLWDSSEVKRPFYFVPK